MVKAREQLRVAGRNLKQEEPQSKPILVDPMGWMAGGRVRGRTNHMAVERVNPRLLPAKSWSASDDPPEVDT